MEVLITGGAGFVGSNLALLFKRDFPSWRIVSMDNLQRRGSELNLSRLLQNGVEFIHGDIRIIEDIEKTKTFDLLLECSAEPSVLAGHGGSPVNLYQCNLTGTLNCLEVCRKQQADIIFLSSSRVYPIQPICDLKFHETDTRFVLDTDDLPVPGIGEKGISERFPLEGVRSLYGATKLSSELMLREFIDVYDMRGIINRCGVLTGPWQMGKVDQGFVVLWAARHLWGGPLSYIGFGGKGKQVRDILHVNDLYALLKIQIGRIGEFNGEVYNVGGGYERSISLQEMTQICREATGNEIEIDSVPETRYADIPYYVTDTEKIEKASGWKPEIGVRDILGQILEWLKTHEKKVKPILG